MMAVDTNLLIRFLTRDDESQARAVYSLFKRAGESREPLWVPLLVVLETIWVLESAYGKSRSEVLLGLEDLAGLSALKFEREPVIRALIVEGRRSKCDLSDLLIALSAQASGCETVFTFDRKALQSPLFRSLTK